MNTNHRSTRPTEHALVRAGRQHLATLTRYAVLELVTYAAEAAALGDGQILILRVAIRAVWRLGTHLARSRSNKRSTVWERPAYNPVHRRHGVVPRASARIAADTWIMAKSSGKEAETVTADFARQWWKSLMANAVSLVEDAALLASHDSTGRAQSLVVLAMEELAKACWLYEAAKHQWTAPLGIYVLQPRPAGDVILPEGLRATRRSHAEKLQMAEQFASGPAGFWSLDRRMEYYERPDLETFSATAKQRNLDKQAGFYVDRDGGRIISPLAVTADDISNAIRRTAKAVQMHLTEDHTRQQDAPDATLIDSAEDLHCAVMPYSDPELFQDFVARNSADGDA